MKTINSLLKELPYKIESKNISYYLVISKCFKGFIVRYWDYDTQLLIKQEHKTLLGSLIKTKIALQILKELKEI